MKLFTPSFEGEVVVYLITMEQSRKPHLYVRHTIATFGPIFVSLHGHGPRDQVLRQISCFQKEVS